MRTTTTAAVAIVAMCLSTLAAEAQPTLTASTTAVTPGATVTLTCLFYTSDAAAE